MPTTAKSAQGASPESSFAGVTAKNQDAMDGFMEISQAIFNGLVEYNKELTNFVAGRVVTDLELQQHLFECRSMEDVMSLQGDFVQNAVDQYTAEAKKLASIGADVVKEDLDVITRRTRSSSEPSRSTRKRSA